MYKASLIISVYKNTAFLRTVLDSLKYQTEHRFEIIITEDGKDEKMHDFVAAYQFEQDHQHLTQEDTGWRKNRALNNAIRAARSPWLIFIDGDCVLHPRFVEMHINYADEQYILAGKRVKLDTALSTQLMTDPTTVLRMQKQIISMLFSKDNELAFVEEGVYIAPGGPFGWIPKMRKLSHLKGCNMSFSKAAITAINGFDEDYTLPAVGEDADLSWRFKAAGYQHKSLRNLAVQYHLYHTESWTDQSVNLKKMSEKQKRNEFICMNGLTNKTL